MSDQNKDVVRRSFDAINKGDAATLLGHLHPKFHDTHQAALRAAKAAFPNMQLEIEDIIAEGDKVVTRWTMHGTHTGEAAHGRMGMVKPTHKPIHVSGITIHQMEGGKVINTWGVTNELHALVQLGLVEHYASAVAVPVRR